MPNHCEIAVNPARNARTAPRATLACVRILPAAALLVALAAGCDTATSDRDLVYLEPAAANAQLQQKARMFEAAINGCYVDPRSAKEYAAGHIPGAIHLPMEEMRDAAGERLAGHNMYVVYDTDYADIMGKAGAKRLLELGFKNVYTLRGGLKAWQKDGYSVVTGMSRGGDAKAPEQAPAAK
jgi:rhodanese-related sulfurtransferase